MLIQNGNLTQAWDYWKHYNATEKRIAFKNGKLLAFCASSNDVTWWNREDKAHSGIPYTVKKHGSTIEYSYNEETGKTSKIREYLPDGTRREWYENGQPQYEQLPDGTKREWYDNGQLSSEYLADGTVRLWHENGNKKFELTNETIRSWYENGNKKSDELPDGTKRGWYKNGQMSFEELPDGTSRKWYANGNKKLEHLPDGTIREWFKNGQIAYEQLPDGTLREWDEDGHKYLDIKYDEDENERESYHQSARRADNFMLTPEAQRQMDEVRAKYEGTSQWLKAPNGKRTHLTEHQWLQVRRITPNMLARY